MSSGLKMLQKSKRYSWAVTGTEILAFFNFIAALVALLICLGILFLYINESINHTDKIDAFMWCMCFGINLGVLITFVFSVLLYLGIYKKITSFLLSYFVFGVVIDIILLLTVVASQYVSINEEFKECLRQAFGDIYEPVTYTVVGICVVHIFLLSMVYRAWSSIRSGRSEDYQKLANDSIWTTDLSEEVVSPKWLKNLEEISELSAPKLPKWAK